MRRAKKRGQTPNSGSSESDISKEPTIPSLIGQTIDPMRLELRWSCKDVSDGHEITGGLVREERLRGEDLLEQGVLEIGGGSGMPVMVYATICTDEAYCITSIDIDSYATNGPAHGRPIFVDVTGQDERQVAMEVARFLNTPRLTGGRLVEDRTWLEEAIPRFNELSRSIYSLDQQLPAYQGKLLSPDKARANGWIVDLDRTTYIGHFQLITDLDGMSFWMGVLIEVDQQQKVKSVKCILNEDGPPTPEQVQDQYAHDRIEGFNFARLRRLLDTITQD